MINISPTNVAKFLKAQFQRCIPQDAQKSYKTKVEKGKKEKNNLFTPDISITSVPSKTLREVQKNGVICSIKTTALQKVDESGFDHKTSFMNEKKVETTFPVNSHIGEDQE